MWLPYEKDHVARLNRQVRVTKLAYCPVELCPAMLLAPALPEFHTLLPAPLVHLQAFSRQKFEFANH